MKHTAPVFSISLNTSASFAPPPTIKIGFLEFLINCEILIISFSLYEREALGFAEILKSGAFLSSTLIGTCICFGLHLLSENSVKARSNKPYAAL